MCARTIDPGVYTIETQICTSERSLDSFGGRDLAKELLGSSLKVTRCFCLCQTELLIG